MPAPIAPEIAQTFELAHPIIVQGTPYGELNARRPKVKDLRIMSQGADKDPVGAYNKFIASICTVPPNVIDELDLADFKAIQDWVKDFLPKNDE